MENTNEHNDWEIVLDESDTQYLEPLYEKMEGKFNEKELFDMHANSPSGFKTQEYFTDFFIGLTVRYLLKQLIENGSMIPGNLKLDDVVDKDTTQAFTALNVDVEDCFAVAMERLKDIVPKIKQREFSDYFSELDIESEENNEDLITSREITDSARTFFGDLFDLWEQGIVNKQDKEKFEEFVRSIPEFQILKKDELRLAEGYFISCCDEIVKEDEDDFNSLDAEGLARSHPQDELETYDEKIRLYVAGQVMRVVKRLLSEHK